MFIAMNRFKIVIEKGKEFEKIWENRTSSLKDVPGFLEFHLVKGSTEDDHTLYASHTIWKTKKDFHKWTKSQAFKDAHKNAGKHGHLYLGPPKFEGFDVVL